MIMKWKCNENDKRNNNNESMVIMANEMTNR